MTTTVDRSAVGDWGSPRTDLTPDQVRIAQRAARQPARDRAVVALTLATITGTGLAIAGAAYAVPMSLPALAAVAGLWLVSVAVLVAVVMKLGTGRALPVLPERSSASPLPALTEGSAR